MEQIELAAPRGHPLTKLKQVRLRDLTSASFVWFPRREAPALYDRLLHECFRGGLKSPRIIQEGQDEATILSLVATGLGVGWVLRTARWHRPKSVAILSVVDLVMPQPLSLTFKHTNEPILTWADWETANLSNSTPEVSITRSPPFGIASRAFTTRFNKT